MKILSEDALPSQRVEPKLFVPLGRGSRGKTFLLRWLIERAQAAGRDVVVADLDRTNRTLSAFFEGVISPQSADDRDVLDFLSTLLERQIEERFSLAIDFGGGDLILKRMAQETDLVSFLNQYGIRPIAVYLLGPDRQDLAYLESLEHENRFAPEGTILVLNEALCPAHRTPLAYFESTIRSDPIFVRTIQRGAKLVRMPRLEPAGEIDGNRLAFGIAEDGRSSHDQGIGPWKRQQISIWRRSMEKAFAPVEDWLALTQRPAASKSLSVQCARVYAMAMPQAANIGDRLVKQLHAAARQAGVRDDDPLMPIINTWSQTVQYLTKRLAESDRIANGASERILLALVQSRAAADAEAERFRTKLAIAEAETVQYVADAVVRRSDATWARRVRAIDRSTALLFGCILFVAAASGFVMGNRSGQNRIESQALVDVPDATLAWLQLMAWNDPRKALAVCKPEATRVQDGRHWCSVPLWVEKP